MVAWDRVFLPIQFGGVGLHSFLAMQYAYNYAIIIRMYNTTSLLSVWLSQRYKSPWKPVNLAATPLWKYVCHMAVVAKSNFIFKITPTAPIAVHWDHWCYNGDLDSFSDGHYVLQATNPNMLIRDLICDNYWSLPNCIPDNVQLAIRDIPIYLDSNSCVSWNNLKHSRFSDYINDFHSSKPICSWYKLIWHKKYALRFTVFSWLALVGGLKTADALLLWNISVPSSCSLCHVFPESSSHIFFECSYSYDILINLIPSTMHLLFRPNILHLLEWISDDSDTAQPTKNYYSLITCCSVYHIWKERNMRRFGNTFSSSSTTAITIKKAVLCWICNVVSDLVYGPSSMLIDYMRRGPLLMPAALDWTHLVNDATPKQAPFDGLRATKGIFY
ncbi:uncharacterized protein LOC110107718 [Dendrobium catenatum]|uniref:uncharacterized protein LOC110107718 n=1 Tax=Dendrobium catenatum TaxID=906689 RepID=UPI0009F47A4D|nr:uncharacterized protein LOC110107718 [Dendrobium catenatum]